MATKDQEITKQKAQLINCEREIADLREKLTAAYDEIKNLKELADDLRNALETKEK